MFYARSSKYVVKWSGLDSWSDEAWDLKVFAGYLNSELQPRQYLSSIWSTAGMQRMTAETQLTPVSQTQLTLVHSTHHLNRSRFQLMFSVAFLSPVSGT
jgi:hypothetical protein